MRLKLTQECGQKWYRRSSWRRPLWRKLQTRIINKGRLIDTDWTAGVGISARFEITEYKYITRGVAFGPIMFFWKWS